MENMSSFISNPLSSCHDYGDKKQIPASTLFLKQQDEVFSFESYGGHSFAKYTKVNPYSDLSAQQKAFKEDGYTHIFADTHWDRGLYTVGQYIADLTKMMNSEA